MQGLAVARRRAGWSQAELARRAGVSRQLVGAVEAGRHLPRVDAALALASALGTTVDVLFAARPVAVDVLSGAMVPDDALVRAGRIGDRIVTAAVEESGDGWGVADAVVRNGAVERFAHLEPGLVVAGCEPGLHLLELTLRERGMGAVAVEASTAVARRALMEHRLHAAVVHGPADQHPAARPGVVRFGLASWRVGLAMAPDAVTGWVAQAQRGETPVIQREAGAEVQRTFQEWLGASAAPLAGSYARSHLDAARRAVLTRLPAVTIEPAALAVGALFHPVDVHVAELWIDRRWLTELPVTSALDVVTSRRFQQRLSAVGGYDLTACGAAVA